MVGLIVFFIYNCQNKSNNSNQSIESNEYFDPRDCENDNENGIHKKKHKKHNKHDKHDKHGKKSKKYNKKINNLCSIINGSDHPRPRVNKNQCIKKNNDFVEMQYHKDYNDTITAINNLTPQKELFNMGFLPVNQSIPDEKNVNELVQLFMNKLNAEVSANVSEYLHTNSGWSDMGKRRREKSGFEQTMEELGLPGTLYNEPAAKAPVKLVAIDKAEQFNTDDQIRFTIYLIVQKENVKDQMVLKVLFFMEKDEFSKSGSGSKDTKVDPRRDFFERNLDGDGNLETDKNQLALIEQVFTVGYLTNDSEKKTQMDKFHDYKDIKRSDGTMNQEQVVKLMLQKHQDRANELNSFLCTVDDGTKEIHDVPEINNQNQYVNIKTIMDDLSHFPSY